MITQQQPGYRAGEGVVVSTHLVATKDVIGVNNLSQSFDESENSQVWSLYC